MGTAAPAPAPAPAPDPRSTRPGSKRLLITVTTLISFLIGSPFLYKSTQVYRASLPFHDIDAYAAWASSSALQLRCHLHVHFASPARTSFTEDANVDSIASRIQQRLQQSYESSSWPETRSCPSGFALSVTLDAPDLCLISVTQAKGTLNATVWPWPCGLGESSIMEKLRLSDNDAVDQILWNFSTGDYSDSAAVDPTADEDHGGLYTVVVFLDGTKDDFPAVVGKYRHAWIFWGGVDTVSEVEVDALATSIAQVGVNFFGGFKLRGSTDDKMRSMPLSADGEAILSFSLLNANPGDWTFNWNFQDLEERFLLSIVKALKGVARLKVESQVLYYTPKAVQSHWAPALNAHVVTAKQLPLFVNANEWHLDSSSAAAGRSKILHFAIYVPAANEWPLRFQVADGQLSTTNAFTSPGWGGLVVWNPDKEVTPAAMSHGPAVFILNAKDFEPLAGVFVAQLRTLFGLPPSPLEDAGMGVFSLPARRTGFSSWERDVLLRRRAINDVAAAATTLTSLSRLVRKLPNMLIMDEIGDQVKASLTAAAATREYAAQGTYQATAEAARLAKSLAEAAFFHPSISSLLYNPTEHHLAIYTPFFVPVILHVALAVLKEASRSRREWKRFKQKLQ